ncbi:MAG: hypothetical protein ACXVW2_00250 [Nocardioidaceae bacterium]
MVRRRGRGPVWIGLLLVAALAVGVIVRVSLADAGPSGPTGVMVTSPPSRAGYFHTLPAGSWSRLPGDQACADRVHQSGWEPRPDNYGPNHQMPDAAAVHRAFAARPVASGKSYRPVWDRWLLQRVDGQYTGTTDEIIQWAACKWGISDNLLRAMAVQESTWNNHLVYRTGRCVPDRGCGDVVQTPSRATRVFCNGIGAHGHDYQVDYGPGRCPETFGMMGVKSWQAPQWGPMPGNQNGTFPFNRDSTAFSADYLAAQLRGCYEGWETWLGHTSAGGYRPGRLWGCVGAWYAGAWLTPAARGYVDGVRSKLAARVWLDPRWDKEKTACSSQFGCPVPNS